MNGSPNKLPPEEGRKGSLLLSSCLLLYAFLLGVSGSTGVSQMVGTPTIGACVFSWFPFVLFFPFKHAEQSTVQEPPPPTHFGGSCTRHVPMSLNPFVPRPSLEFLSRMSYRSSEARHSSSKCRVWISGNEKQVIRVSSIALSTPNRNAGGTVCLGAHQAEPILRGPSCNPAVSAPCFSFPVRRYHEGGHTLVSIGNSGAARASATPIWIWSDLSLRRAGRNSSAPAHQPLLRTIGVLFGLFWLEIDDTGLGWFLSIHQGHPFPKGHLCQEPFSEGF